MVEAHAFLAAAAGAAAGAADQAVEQREALTAMLRGLVSGVGFVAAAAASVLAGLGVIALALWLDALYPRATARVARVYDASRGGVIRCFIAGIVNVFIGTFLVALFTQLPALNILAFLLIIVLAVIAVFGLSGAYKTLGARLLPHGPPAAQLLAGGAVITAAFLTPVVGQLLFLAVLLRSFGAAVLAMLGAGSAGAPEEDKIGPT